MIDEQTILTILDNVPAGHRHIVYQSFGMDPSKTPMRCERAGCAAVVPLEATFSPALFLRHTGRGDVASHMCDEAVTGQHYYCSLACADAGVVTCWHEHIKPKLARLHAERVAEIAQRQADDVAEAARLAAQAGEAHHDDDPDGAHPH